MSKHTARVAAAVVSAALLALPAVAGAEAEQPPLRDSDYWALVERSFTDLDGWWSPSQRAYVENGAHSPQVRVNAGMLTIHAIAALEGHVGRARNDARARTLVDRFTSPPMWGGARTDAGSHTVCWSASMDRPAGGHAAIEPKVAESLAWAWRARATLEL